MLTPAEFLSVARLLADPAASRSPPDAQLRRAVSTAYYALFHAALTAAAQRFMGTASTNRPGYAILYRSFDHSRMKRLCADVDKPTMTALLQKQLGRATIDADLRAFATAFTDLQQMRHRADYDPHLDLGHVDAVDSVSMAEQGVEALDRAPADERTDFLALLLGNARG